jgi:hypothetical protein
MRRVTSVDDGLRDIIGTCLLWVSLYILVAQLPANLQIRMRRIVDLTGSDMGDVWELEKEKKYMNRE